MVAKIIFSCPKILKTILMMLKHAWSQLDARWFQIIFLLSLLTFGVLLRDFAVSYAQIAACLSAALLTQIFWQWTLKLPTRKQMGGYLSAVVSALGISILVRAENAWAHPLLAALAMSSKYLLRLGPSVAKSHVFNPANLAAFLAWYAVPGAWLSPGQWGFETSAALWMLALGGLVTGRIARWDVSLAFLATWGALLVGRSLWLGYTDAMVVAMWIQQMSNGTILLFAFFMISDPMTTPQSHVPRMCYAIGVALAAFIWQYVLYRPHGLIVMLFAASLCVPLINWCWPKVRFSWQAAALKPPRSRLILARLA
jgi:enediyne biosynthesis protein E5